MESKKINQLATELAPDLSDITIIGDPTTGISKKITLSQMASLFTGTVEEYANFAAFPLVGVADTIYIAKDTNVIYRWDSTAYVVLSPNIIASLVFNDANGFDGTIALVGSVATLTITTALTTGSVGFIGASGALLQDNANFFWDDTNNRLGLGTNAPTTALDVFGSGIIGRLNGTSTNNAYLGFASAGTNKWSIGNVQSDHRFRIFSEANSAELVSVLQTGEFGIGIANPTTKFHIDGAASALIANLDANVSVAKSISFRSDNSNRINLEVSGTESGSNVGADLFIRRYSDLGALIDTPLTITRSTGTSTFGKNIGIVTTPYAWVSTGRAIQIGEFVSVSQQHNGSGEFINNGYESGSSSYKYITTGGYALRLNLNPNDGSINFFNAPIGTSGNTITWSNKFTISSTGAATFSDNVLINNTASLSKIAIKGSGSTTGLDLYVFGANATLSNQDNGSLAFQTNGTDRLLIASTGSIGIGTILPKTYSTLTNSGQLINLNNIGIDVGQSYRFNNYYNSGTGTDRTISTGYGGAIGFVNATGSMLFYTSTSSVAADNNVTTTERLRIANMATGGFLKASNDGSTYVSIGSPYHEFNNTANSNNTIFYSTHASLNTDGIIRIDALRNTTNNSYYVLTYYNGTTGTYKFRVADSGNVTNTNNSYGAISDIKLKENIIDATPKLDNLLKIKIRNFNYIGSEEKQLGVIAQELEQIFPAMVDKHEDFEEVEIIDEEGNATKERQSLGTFTKSVKYSVFVPMLIKAMQEQQAQIEELKAKIK